VSVLERMRAIAALRGLTGTQKAVLWALQLRADNDTGECWPSLVTIAEDAGVSRSCVKLVVPQLVALGHISKRNRHREGVLEADSNVYRVHVKGGDASPRGPRSGAREVGHQVTQVGHDVTHLVGHDVAQVGHEVTGGGSRGDRQVGHEVTGGGSRGDLELLTELPKGTAQGTGEALALPLELPTAAPAPVDQARGQRIPTDWRPKPETLAWAREQGVDGEAVVEEFRDYWQTVPGARGRKASWELTFKGRIRQLIEQGRAPVASAADWQSPVVQASPDGEARARAIIDTLASAKSARNIKGVSHGRA
jgi:hypothetical protein